MRSPGSIPRGARTCAICRRSAPRCEALTPWYIWRGSRTTAREPGRDHGGQRPWNLERAARRREEQRARVVYASSGKALGLLEREPFYLPVDDAHPGLPSRPYGLSKWLSEQLCEAFTNETEIPTVCLRPVLVLDEEGWRTLRAGGELPPRRGQSWHLGVFVVLDDVVDAVAAAIVGRAWTSPGAAVCRGDRCAAAHGRARGREPAKRPWRDGQPYRDDSRRALVDCSVARELLEWRPSRGMAAMPCPQGDNSIQLS